MEQQHEHHRDALVQRSMGHPLGPFPSVPASTNDVYVVAQDQFPSRIAQERQTSGTTSSSSSSSYHQPTEYRCDNIEDPYRVLRYSLSQNIRVC